MNETANRLRQYVRNGILSTYAVRRHNYHLFKLWQSNRVLLSSIFEEEGTEILDDGSEPVCTDEGMKSLLRYRFGEDVVVRAKDDHELYQRVYYRARKHGMGVAEYLVYLGFKEKPEPDVVRMHEVQKLSFREIGMLLDLPKSTVYRKYTEAKKGE